MEKICIVRRRIQIPALSAPQPFHTTNEHGKTKEFSNLCSCGPDGKSKKHVSPLRSTIRGDDHIIRIQLNPDQCKVVQSNGCLNHVLGKILENVDIDIERYEDGQIVFNLHLKQIQRTDMLDSKKVCQMLQISRSFLSRLVRTDQIRSYKIGKLRRFLLEDILEYLSQGKEFPGSFEQFPDRASGVLMEEQLGKQPAR